MQAALGLVVMLLGVSRGLESSCDGRQDGAQCLGALGGTLNMWLVDDASEIPIYKLYKGDTQILNGRKEKFFINYIKNRSEFIPQTGTFIMNKLNRDDSGNYTLDIFDENGIKLANRTLQLFIQAPVSSVQLTVDCLSEGDKKVSCSSEGGESPRYNWTLDGWSLTDAELLPGDNQTNTVTLGRHVTGELLCLVYNDVSSVSKMVTLNTCGYVFINCTTDNGTEISEWVYKATNTLCVDPTTALTTSVGKMTSSVMLVANITTSNQTVTSGVLSITAGVLIALVIFFIVGIVVFCTHKKKQSNKPQDEGDQELIYADVRVIGRPGRTAEPPANAPVEYGEVRFSDGSRQAGAAGDECVYSLVRNAR